MSRPIVGPTGIEAVLTGATCGEACWEAREDVCRCSCAGANHGATRDEAGVRPYRTRKLDGHMYRLHSSGSYSEMERLARTLNEQSGMRHRYGPGYEIPYRATDRGAPARCKGISRSEAERWPEFAAYRVDKNDYWPYWLAVWVRVDHEWD